jgi:hypothetical protein
MAWAVLLLGSGDQAAADPVAVIDGDRERALEWLRDHPLADNLERLRARARRELFGARVSELAGIRERTTSC